jgi:hypothetical protein
MHYARAAHAVVGDGKSLYALAGTGASGAPVLVFERFDARTWHDEGSIPRPGLNARAAVVLEGTIHALGGGNSKSTIADHDVFDPAKNAWTTLAPLPRAEGSPAAVHSAESSMRSAVAAVLPTLAQSTSTTLPRTSGRGVRQSTLAVPPERLFIATRFTCSVVNRRRGGKASAKCSG